MQPSKITEPWKSFFSETDAAVTETVELHCLGGFVVTMLYGLPRPTADVDVLTISPKDETGSLLEMAGKGSALHKKYGIYLDPVAVATIPEDYDQRLTEMFPGTFEHIRLLAFDPYDLALAKLERNIQRDRDDVRHLARSVPFELALLKERYEKEMRPYLAAPSKEDLTLRLWIEAIEEERGEIS